MRTEEITDYASFLKAKYALKAEAELERTLIGDELKKGAKQFAPSNFLPGVIENAMSGLVDRIVDSSMAQKVTSALSMVTFVKDMFKGKKAENEAQEQ